MSQEVFEKQLEFDPDNVEQIEWIVENSDKFETPLTGLNEDDEMITIEVTDEFILVKTFQKNGWTRNNYYYPDGYREELYER